MDKQVRSTKRKGTKVSQGKCKANPSKASAEPKLGSQKLQPEAACHSPPLLSEPETILKSPSASRSTSKLSKVVEMLRTPDGASIADIMKATDWQAHSVRGAIAGAIKKKLGLSVISERRGDERFYRIAG
jgi:hypothetical protein